ncbi:EAL domain-containing protein [Actinoplanes sp. NPDC051633]|uniref:putative bifunctional diguanylate cyclase/phosphodiesterase n=1 Tax=Actinoplanes sp. NPDC051633 TaxID=3155670 RepID=UPI003439798B
MAGGMATGGYFLLPDGSLARNLAYNAIGLCSALLIVLAVRRLRPARARMWYLFAAGQAMWVVGDGIYEYYQYVLEVEPYPSPADIFYLAAYPLMVLGLLELFRDRRGRDLAGLIDGSIVAIGLGLVFWVFVLHPISAAGGASATEWFVSTAYPVADALLLAMLARMFMSAERRTASTRLLAAAVALMFVADVLFSLFSLYADVDTAWLDAGWLLSYVTWAAAALHPSMASATAERPRKEGTGRLVLLAISSLLAPILLIVPRVGNNVADRLVIAGGSVLLFLLVVVRMSGFLRQVQRQAGQLRDLAMLDDLTGLPNRRSFEHGLRAALATGHPHVALLDLDSFKSVNDDLGHATGDQLLETLGTRFAAAMPPEAMIARMGGDEFAVLVPAGGEAAIDAVVHRLTAALRAPVRAGDHELVVTASIGSTGSAGTTDPLEVMRRADIAMYAAKGAGLRSRRYSPELDENLSAQALLGAELRAALTAGEFRLHYQPIVSLPEGRPVAVEALVRWAHPTRGLVGPGDFVPTAERDGFIVELGAWILRTACHQAARWRAELGDRAPEKVSVNVSARQLAHPGFLDTVASALADAGLPPAFLAVEVTETAVFDGRSAAVLHELKALGVRIALDDFGTGHSSLTLLRTVPVDILKVDKSFVDEITGAGRPAVIAMALIQVSDGLGLTAVAEGVETAEQAAELHRMGYRLAQGYHFGRPAPTFSPAEPIAGTILAAGRA